MRARPLAILAVMAGFGASPAWGHDFWLEPSTFHPAAGTAVGVGLRVGQDFIGDPLPRRSSAIDRFFVRQGRGEETIGGADGIDPAGFLRASGGITAVIGYSGGGYATELPADRFNDYLRQYGLDEALADRARRGEMDQPARDAFYRSAKALLTGAAESLETPQPLGFRCELVPDRDPTRRFEALQGHLLYKGEPVAGALVRALPRDRPASRLSARSGPDGGFALDLPTGGVWLITSVHIVRAGFFSGADWESCWSSLVFDMPEEPTP